MKYLFVIDSLGSGGAQRQLVTLARGFCERGHTVEFFVYHPHLTHFRQDLESIGVKIHSCERAGRSSLFVVSELRKVLQAGNYDVCLAFLIAASFYAELACIGINNTKLIISERFMYPIGRMPFSLYWLQQAHRLADHITVNSHHQRERMVKKFPWMRNRISTIYNGVDLAKFNATYSPERHDNDHLLSIGSVVRKKNAHNLIEGLRIARDKHAVDVRVAWAGKIADQAYFEECEASLKEFDLCNNWQWLGEQKDIPELLSRFDAVVHPSFLEGLPNAICEALATSRPVLASAVCDHPILVADTERGFLFEPERPESIAEAIAKFHHLTDSERQSVSLNSRRYAESELTNRRLVDQYEELFINLTSS